MASNGGMEFQEPTLGELLKSAIPSVKYVFLWTAFDALHLDGMEVEGLELASDAGGLERMAVVGASDVGQIEATDRLVAIPETAWQTRLLVQLGPQVKAREP